MSKNRGQAPVLGTIGAKRVMDFGVAVGYGVNDQPQLWISVIQDGPTGPNREVHVAFTAPDAATVRAFYETALANGGQSLHEPRLWPEFHPGYYGAFVRDPDGNNIEAVCHTGGD